MNFLEAYATGKRIRRTHLSFGINFGDVVEFEKTLWILFKLAETVTHRYPLTLKDITANDWVVEPEPKKKKKLYAYLGLAGSIKLRSTQDFDMTRLPQFDTEIEE